MIKRLPACKPVFLTLIFFAAMLLLPGFSKMGWGQAQTFSSSGTFTSPAGVPSISKFSSTLIVTAAGAALLIIPMPAHGGQYHSAGYSEYTDQTTNAIAGNSYNQTDRHKF